MENMQDIWRKYVRKHAKPYYGAKSREYNTLHNIYRSLETCGKFRFVKPDDWTCRHLQYLRKVWASGAWYYSSGKRAEPWSRPRINSVHSHFMNGLRWAVRHGYLKRETYELLKFLPKLRKRKKGTRLGGVKLKETIPVQPVPEDVFWKTIENMKCESARDILTIGFLTGARLGELCQLKKGHIAHKTDDIWFADLPEHKTTWRGKMRVIVFGPKCIAILKRQFAKKRYDWRTTPIFRRQRGMVGWTVSKLDAYIANTCRTHGIPHWSVGQLRHTRSTIVGNKYGSAAESAYVGHSAAVARRIYIEHNLALAEQVAKEIG
jgi:integrase